jgi:hypothetical protein
MSYYGVYETPTVDYMVCSGCEDEAFTWMAEVFPCPNCGGTEYVDPVTNGSGTEDFADDTTDGGREGWGADALELERRCEEPVENQHGTAHHR